MQFVTIKMEMNDHIQYINVGGKILATMNSTLCQIQDSHLAHLFSGRWEHKYDENGYIFLDYNSQHFSIILDYLRAKKSETTSESATLFTLSLKDKVPLKNLADYLGIFPSAISHDFDMNEQVSEDDICKFNIHSEGLVLYRNGGMLKHVEGNHHEYAIGKDEVNGDGSCQWQLQLDEVKTDSKIFIGVLDTQYRDEGVSHSLTERMNYIHSTPVYQWKGCYGWVLGENVQIFSDGQIVGDFTYGCIGIKDDIINLYLDVKVSDISTRTEIRLNIKPSNVNHRIPVPNSKTWQIVIGSYNSDDCVSFI